MAFSPSSGRKKQHRECVSVVEEPELMGGRRESLGKRLPLGAVNNRNMRKAALKCKLRNRCPPMLIPAVAKQRFVNAAAKADLEKAELVQAEVFLNIKRTAYARKHVVILESSEGRYEEEDDESPRQRRQSVGKAPLSSRGRQDVLEEEEEEEDEQRETEEIVAPAENEAPVDPFEDPGEDCFLSAEELRAKLDEALDCGADPESPEISQLIELMGNMPGCC